jgi:hypothetical protein
MPEVKLKPKRSTMMVNVYVVIQESTDGYHSRDFVDVFGSREAALKYISERDYQVQDEYRVIKKTIST